MRILLPTGSSSSSWQTHRFSPPTFVWLEFSCLIFQKRTWAPSGHNPLSVPSNGHLLLIFSPGFLLWFLFKFRNFFPDHFIQTYHFFLLSHSRVRSFLSISSQITVLALKYFFLGFEVFCYEFHINGFSSPLPTWLERYLFRS